MQHAAAYLEHFKNVVESVRHVKDVLQGPAVNDAVIGSQALGRRIWVVKIKNDFSTLISGYIHALDCIETQLLKKVDIVAMSLRTSGY